MDVGMLWFDDGPRSFKEKVHSAVDFYTEKYGQTPTLCMVNPSTINGGEETVAGVQVRPARTVIPHHFWIGIEKTNEPDQPSKKTKPKVRASKNEQKLKSAKAGSKRKTSAGRKRTASKTKAS